MCECNIIKDTTVDSFEELAGLVQRFRKSGSWAFRGVRKSNYELIPKIGRPESRKRKGDGNNVPYDRHAETTMIGEFIRSARPYLKHIPATQLEWLALAQHYGMATRLLDWSTSLLVAAYFAVKDASSDSTPTIYCIRNVALAPPDNHDCLDELNDVTLYYPPHISPRIPAQSGLFTVHRNPDKPLVTSSDLVRITIVGSPLTFKLNLNACGIHQASLFPDIGGLAEYQSWRYKWAEQFP